MRSNEETTGAEYRDAGVRSAAIPPSLSRNQNFLNLTGAQFLGHFNDHVFKMVVSLIAIEAAQANAGFYVSLGSTLVVLPYLLFSGYAGHLADVYSKRSVMLLCKGAEIMITGVGLLLLVGSGTIEGLLAVLFLMAAHETFFSPAKYGCIPEIVADRDIIRANGVLEASRYVAIIAGTVVGGLVMEAWNGERHRIGLLTITIAIAGLFLTQRIKRLESARGPRPWPGHPWSGLPEGLRRLGRCRTLAVAASTLTFFESLAVLVLLNALLFAKVELGASHAETSLLSAFAALGCASGALLCGRISGPKIELGIVPLAALGVATVLTLLATRANAYPMLAGLLFALGVFGGLFFLPCLSWLQQATASTEKGLILSTSNMLSMVGVLSASTGLWLLHDVIGMAPNAIFGIGAVCTLLYVIIVLIASREIRWRVLAIGSALSSRPSSNAN